MAVVTKTAPEVAPRNPVQQAAAPSGTLSQQSAQSVDECDVVPFSATQCSVQMYARQDSNL